MSFRGQSSHELLHPPTAVYVPQQVRLEREKDVYFTPSRSVTTAMEEKTPSGLPPHYRDDEGLFVGRRPKTKWTNHVTVENRLLHRYDKVLHFTSALYMYVIQSDVWLYRCIIYDSCIWSHCVLCDLPSLPTSLPPIPPSLPPSLPLPPSRARDGLVKMASFSLSLTLSRKHTSDLTCSPMILPDTHNGPRT